MSYYTDLAMEARELDPDIKGVTEEKDVKDGVEISRIDVLNDDAAKKLGKSKGRYVTLEAKDLALRPLSLFSAAAAVFADELASILSAMAKSQSVLIVGLGNENVTPDSLGPRTVHGVYATNHFDSAIPGAFDNKLRSVSKIAPGVLGTTGIETFDVLKGIKEAVQPDLIIAVDSLASRRASRISTTIQLSNAGIEPGSGVGNLRKGLNEDGLGIPVIAIGVPLVVHASTITRDALLYIASQAGINDSEASIEALAKKASDEKLEDLIVTPKDIDTIVRDMSGILSEGINRALFGSDYDEVRALSI